MEELVPEWGWRREKRDDSRDKVKHNGRSDQLFLERMMKVAEQDLLRMKTEYCEEVEWKWGYEGMEVG